MSYFDLLQSLVSIVTVWVLSLGSNRLSFKSLIVRNVVQYAWFFSLHMHGVYIHWTRSFDSHTDYGIQLELDGLHLHLHLYICTQAIFVRLMFFQYLQPYLTKILLGFPPISRADDSQNYSQETPQELVSKFSPNWPLDYLQSFANSPLIRRRLHRYSTSNTYHVRDLQHQSSHVARGTTTLLWFFKQLSALEPTSTCQQLTFSTMLQDLLSIPQDFLKFPFPLKRSFLSRVSWPIDRGQYIKTPPER